MIADFLAGEVVGDDNAAVSTFAKIEEGRPGALSFLSNHKYEPYLYETESSVVIVNRDLTPSKPVRATMVRVDDAYTSFAKLLELYVANLPQKKGVAASAVFGQGTSYGEDCYFGDYAVVGDGVRIGKGCKIYPHVFIDDNVTLGDNVTLYSGVKIYHGCQLGSNVIIHSGAVIGADGFGFAPNTNNEYEKIPQIGVVVIEDNVELGANTCVDRATMGATVIRRGVKLDNLIQIAHNVEIGENTVSAAQLGVAGSTKVGANCMMGGQVGIIGHLKIGNGVQIASKSGVLANVADGDSVMGFPAFKASDFKRSFTIYKKLPAMSTAVDRLGREARKREEER
jgi:UDP-3-O-[3-hydroxymyristoyl] glucosamine N-acyltransferase